MPATRLPLYTRIVQADVPRGSAWLGERERAALSRMRFTRRRASWRLGRWTAKLAVAAALGRAEESGVEIVAAADGAPEAWVEGRHAGVEVSIGHAGGTCLCVVAPGKTALGCDVEVVEDRGLVLARDYFTPAERERACAATSEAQPLLETLIWSAKESALKAARVGLRSDTRRVEIVLPPDALAPGADTWRPFAVLPTGWFGWWRAEGRFILTTVASVPEPCQPDGVKWRSRNSRRH